MTYACGDPEDVQNIPGAKVALPPAPLLANFGAAAAFNYFSDMQVNPVSATLPIINLILWLVDVEPSELDGAHCTPIR